MKRTNLAFLLAIASTPAFAQLSPIVPACGAPSMLDDGWPIDTPENVGLDGTRLCGIAARLKDISANVHAVVVVRHGKLVF